MYSDKDNPFPVRMEVVEEIAKIAKIARNCQNSRQYQPFFTNVKIVLLQIFSRYTILKLKNDRTKTVCLLPSVT